MKNERRLSRELLRGTGLSPLDAARLIRNLSDCKKNHLGRGTLNAVADSDIYRMGLEKQAGRERSVPFREAVERYVSTKSQLTRRRTNDERRQVLLRVLRAVPEWIEQPIRDWTTAQCRTALAEGFSSVHGRNKGVVQLKGLFRFARQQEWCEDDPMSRISQEKVREQELVLLGPPQIGRLLLMCNRIGYRDCAAAVGLMLWAGIRPTEVARLRWSDIDLQEGVAYLPPQHSKTGGARQVTLQPVLIRWLRPLRPSSYGTPAAAQIPITPRDWVRYWRNLRTEAGLQPWRPDTLRHTFASYHLKFFGDLSLLQKEMGHSSLRQLRTRYLNMRGITAAMAEAFWKGRIDENGFYPPAKRQRRK